VKANWPSSDALGEARRYPLLLLQAFWVLMVFEFDIFLSAVTGAPFYRIPTVLAPLIVFVMFYNKRENLVVYWPLVVFVVLHLGASVFAENRGLARDGFKTMVYMLILFTASTSLLDAPAKVMGIFKLYLLSFVWMAVQGIPGGRVLWHPLLGNEDSYGPLMVIAIAFSYFYSLATPSTKWRVIAQGICLLSVLGLVCSFARGAALSAALVLGYILVFSKNRLRTIVGMLVGAAIVVPLATIFFPIDSYIDEIKSSAEGDSVRMAIWRLGWHVFLESPIYGVGSSNFGVTATQIADYDLIAGVWNDPENLFNFAVHNATVQILAEEGLIGVTVWCMMIGGFFIRTRRLQKAEAVNEWNRRGGQGFDLPAIVRGLEAAMIGYLATSMFYNQLYIHWFWSLFTFGFLLSLLVSPERATGQGTASKAAYT